MDMFDVVTVLAFFLTTFLLMYVCVRVCVVIAFAHKRP